MNPNFEVPAEYFYALAASLPIGVSASDRYALATAVPESGLALQLKQAADAGLIDTNPGGLTPLQAARRLAALGVARAPTQLGNEQAYTVLPADTGVINLINGWLTHGDPLGWQTLPDPDAPVWADLLLPAATQAANDAAQLRLIACALTGWTDLTAANQPLTAFVAAIGGPGLGVSNTDQLAAVPASAWTEFFTLNPQFLPPFTQPPGPPVSTSDRIAAFLQYLTWFYAVPLGGPAPPAPVPGQIPLLDRYGFDPLASFLAVYDSANPPYTFGTTPPASPAVVAAAAAVFPSDVPAQQWLLAALATIDQLVKVTAGLVPAGANAAGLEFSIIEALYARGFTSMASIAALDAADFAEALTGSVAFQWAAQIWANAGGSAGPPPPAPPPFRPVNPHGGLRDCIPPPAWSPLGPVWYLRELLDAGPGSTCAAPKVTTGSFGSLLQPRRGDLGSLLVTDANLQTALPVIDLVDECLEYLAGQVAASGGSVSGTGGVVYDTAQTSVRDHLLRPPDAPPEPGLPYHHNPAVLLGALPEFSSPASPVVQPSAYTALAGDYSSPDLPYAQPLDVARTYLRALKTSRYETMRRFRAQITEFVLGADPPGFDTTVWRYPLRSDIAPEYLEISAAEYQQLFATPIANTGPVPPGELALWQLYGFEQPVTASGAAWTSVVVIASEFLRRTGLSYCELVELSQAGFVPMLRAGTPPGPFDPCEPCHLDDVMIDFGSPAQTIAALAQLAVFIRLWRLLARGRCTRYGFAELADICAVLGLFSGGTINPGFIPQLVAFQILRDELCLPLRHGAAPAGATGVARTPLLALWSAPAAGVEWHWAVGELLARLASYSAERHGRERRGPQFIKVLTANLSPLSRLAGFDPSTATDTWHYSPTRTLRFVEVLEKLYASPFTTGDVEYLFTAHPHLNGEDPFPLQSEDDALDDPLALPDGDRDHSLWELRRRLLEVHVGDDELVRWTWPRIDAWIRDELGYDPAAGPDPLRSLAEHAFPGVLEQAGLTVPVANRRYQVPLAQANTTPGMWNTDPDSPVRYESGSGGSGMLQATVPLSDESVLELLARLRQLNPLEAAALRELYWLPRTDVAALGMLFNDPVEADRHLIQAHDERTRWEYFRRHVALTRERCLIIARHLARHAGGGRPGDEEEEVRDDADGRAWLVLKSLYADENTALTPWESAQPSGAPPLVTWPIPTGGAFAALLGLCGTGLTTTYAAQGGPPVWAEPSGALEIFGEARDRADAPLPTMIPAIGLTPGAASSYVELRNGFAFADRDGRDLGGAQGFSVQLSGVLLVEHAGRYRFAAGAPTPPGEEPGSHDAGHRRWRVTLARGQREWILLSHDWPGQPDTERHTDLELRRGTYDITVDFARPEPDFTNPADLDRARTGLQVKYSGADTGDELITIPYRRLFITEKKPRPRRDGKSAGLGLPERYTSSLRDIRRSYQRAFKAILLTARFELSAQRAEDGQSELGFMLTHPVQFAGAAYHRAGGAFVQHQAQFDLNFLPLLDNYHPPADDDRAAPSAARQAALFDWWERLFDYTELRRENRRAQPHRQRHRLWRLFAAAAAANPGDTLQLLPHLEVPLEDNDLVQRFFGLPTLLGETELSAQNLLDERWPVRAWKAEGFLRRAAEALYATDTAEARPDSWAADDPAAGTPSGNDNLTQFVGDALIENGDPRRYRDLQAIDDGLRERARRALLAYLCGMDRVQLPGGPPAVYARTPKDLSGLLLIDVLAGIGERASRIDDAVTAVQAFVERALLGLEPGVTLPAAFRAVWEGRFKTFRTWQACQRRELYPENTIDCDELERARGDEAFRLLEAKLRQAALSTPVPAGIQYWTDRRPPPHCGLTVLQAAEPSTLHLPVAVPPAGYPADAAVPAENFGLLGRPDRAGRPSWLSPLQTTPPPSPPPRQPVAQVRTRRGRQGARAAAAARRVPGEPEPRAVAATLKAPAPGPDGTVPYWIEAAVGLGVRFLRVAAAGEPAGASLLEPGEAERDKPAECCCCECGRVHPPRVDEYYFWLARAGYYDLPAAQVADLTNSAGESQWEDPATFPTLLEWDPGPMVYLYWCRVHDGEFGQLRRSDRGVALNPAGLATPGPPTLELRGRVADSLVFAVTNGIVPVADGGPVPGGSGGFPWQAPYGGWPVDDGWRYDLADDAAVHLPLIVTPQPPLLLPPSPLFAGLAGYPFFVYFTPGEPVIPLSPFAPAVAVAGALRCHCRFEEALGWYESYYDPFDSDNAWHGASPPPPVARRRSVLLDVLETLMCWGDALMAAHDDCGHEGGNGPEAFAQARVIFDAAAHILGATPRTVLVEPPGPPPPNVGTYTPLAAPLNPRLMTLYLRVADRLELIRDCENRPRRRYGKLGESLSFWGDDHAYWGHDDGCGCPACRDCEPCGCCEPACCPQSPYRFEVLARQALDLAGEVRSLGAALLAAFEKGDAEYLASLRATQEHQVQARTLAIRKDQWRDADWQVQALGQARLSAQNQLAYYTALVANGLNTDEVLYQDLTGVAETLQIAAQAAELVAEGGSGIPDTYVGTVDFIKIPMTGSSFTDFFTAIGKAAEYLAQDTLTAAGLALTEGGWDRRLAEWKHQIDIWTYEIERLNREILGADRRSDAALRELNNQQLLIEQTREIDNFLRDKFTNHALYLWHQRHLSGMHREMYELALATARQAQRAFNIERGHTTEHFVSGELWDNLHEGLLAGERLELDLRRMMKGYDDCNRREYELTKHISLLRDFPVEFLRLKVSGRCEISLPEWMFDLDYPGQFMRRIKNVTLTIPCVTGPYTGIHCRLTLLASTTRIQPWLHGPVGACCHGQHERCECCDGRDRDEREELAERYRPLPGDPRIVRTFTATDAIATSGGTNDAGMFEVSFRDERYLPFEFAGAVSHWRIELPPENNQFDFDTLTDVVVHLNYTSREGGERLRAAASAAACCRLPGDGLRLFDVRHDFPDAWPALRKPAGSRELRLRFVPAMFPFVAERRVRFIDRLMLVFAAPEADPGRHHVVRLRREGAEPEAVECVATSAWPGFFCGVVDLKDRPLGLLGPENSAWCTVEFPDHVGEICSAYVIPRYDAQCWPRCGPPRRPGCCEEREPGRRPAAEG